MRDVRGEIVDLMRALAKISYCNDWFLSQAFVRFDAYSLIDSAKERVKHELGVAVPIPPVAVPERTARSGEGQGNGAKALAVQLILVDWWPKGVDRSNIIIL